MLSKEILVGVFTIGLSFYNLESWISDSGECLGKKKFEELLAGLIAKPPGKPTLVPESDKRPALNTAKDDFSEE